MPGPSIVKMMTDFYANVILLGPSTNRVVGYLRNKGSVGYLTPGGAGTTVIFHEDLAGQEDVATGLSSAFACPAMLGMVFGRSVLLYHLYIAGKQADAYVSSPHEGLDLDGPAPAGSAAVLCAAFGVEGRIAAVERVLRKVTKPGTDYAYAVNRHGELLRALKLPLFAAGSGFAGIDAGELPAGPGFDAASLVRTG
jgi:hypothetical protein